jgi:hypothetical protein
VLVHIGSVDGHGLPAEIGGAVGDVVEHALHHGL